MQNYVNFFLKTSYSLFESTIKIDSLISFAKNNNLEILAIADTNCMFGAIEFYEKCKENNIKPIIGMHIKIPGFSLLVYAKNFKGYKNLIKICSNINDKNCSFNASKIDWENVLVFDLINKSNSLGTNNDLFLLETNCLYDNELEALTMLKKIAIDKSSDSNKKQGQHYLLDPMASKEYLKKTFDFANECNLMIEKQDFKMPNLFDNNPRIVIEEICKKNISKIANPSDVYLKRLNEELNIIFSMNFENYFLIIYDFINWAKKQGIIIGPGRGSAPSSLVCYLLNITEIDPIKHGLFFERFLNNERITFPDIDIDVQDDRRQEVLDYIFNKFSNNNVSQIITFQKFGFKIAMRDILGKIGISMIDIENLLKTIPSELSSKQAYEKSIQFRSQIIDNEKFYLAYKIAQSIEDLPRQIGTHAAGVVISDRSIDEFVPTISIDGKLHTQYSMNFLEKNGLIKIDILGLKNLTIISEIQDSIFRESKRKVNMELIPLNDTATINLFFCAQTRGIFQFETFGMQKILKKFKIKSFYDLVALNALFRPGPIENIDLYIQRKNSNLREAYFKSKILNELLSTTFGIVIYQEQIMQIVQRFAGLSYGKADILRRAISKKQEDLFAKLKEEFFNSAINLGREKTEIEEVFNAILKFANYGFNKSHATSYSLIAFWMAYLKAKFPLHFYSVLMQNHISSANNIRDYFNEARTRNIRFKGVSINLSCQKFRINNSNIIFPLSIIKGLSNNYCTKIAMEKDKNGPFTSFFNFIARMYTHSFQEDLFKSIIKSSALSEFSNARSLLTSLPLALRYSEIIILKLDGLIKIDYSIANEPTLIKESLDIFYDSKFEREFCHLFINFHPIQKFKTNKNSSLINIEKSKFHRVICLIEQIKIIITKGKQEMAFIEVSDDTLSLEVIVFFEKFLKLKHFFKKNTILELDIRLNHTNSYVVYDVIRVMGEYV